MCMQRVFKSQQLSKAKADISRQYYKKQLGFDGQFKARFIS